MDISRPHRSISISVLTMMNLAVLVSVRSLPIVSEFGYASIFYYSLAGLLFFIPSALVAAELATGWPRSGGIYIWVREALGKKWGFLAIWLQWSHNLPFYPSLLFFISSTLAFSFDPALASNKIYILSMTLIIFWGMTLFNLLGMKSSTLMSSIGVIFGTLLPAFFIIALGIAWFFSPKPLANPFTYNELIPNFSFEHLVFLAGLLLAFAGSEVSASYAGEVKNPQKNYPKAIILSMIVTLLVSILGSLAISWVIPTKDINLVQGTLNAFSILLKNYSLGWMLPLLAIMIALGALGELNAWLISPVKALYVTSDDGLLPPILQKCASNGSPSALLIFQGILVTLLSLVIFALPSISISFWILTAISVQIYLLMYILMFVAAIILRHTQPSVPRPYSIPTRHRGMWFVAGIGVISSSIAFFLGFIIPGNVRPIESPFYESFLILGIFVMVLTPLIFYKCRKPFWKRIPS